jgi:hypothetical protein
VISRYVRQIEAVLTIPIYMKTVRTCDPRSEVFRHGIETLRRRCIVPWVENILTWKNGALAIRARSIDGIYPLQSSHSDTQSTGGLECTAEQTESKGIARKEHDSPGKSMIRQDVQTQSLNDQ